MKLAWGTVVQVVIGLIVAGIAWGTLSAKQNAMEAAQASMSITQTQILDKLNVIELRLMRIEDQKRERQR